MIYVEERLSAACLPVFLYFSAVAKYFMPTDAPHPYITKNNGLKLII